MKGPVDHPCVCRLKTYASALAARVQTFAGEEDAGLDQFFVVIAHGGQQFRAGHDAGFGVGWLGDMIMKRMVSSVAVE